MNVIKTIGHSNHPIGRFLALLKAGGVELLVDVRSLPYSRRFPQFGRERLANSLAGVGVDYAWEGEALGGRAGDYHRAAARPAFTDALERLIGRAADHTLCLMCAEKEPLDCHRTLLVSRRLAERGAALEHLLADGGTRTQGQIEAALLAKAAAAAADLFDDRATLLAQAYDAREKAMKRL